MKRVSVIVAGLVAGILAAAVQILFSVSPPPAYGVCIACHARDLVNWIVNGVAGTSLSVAPVSAAAPVLTIVGLVIGAYVASARNGEFKFKITKNPIMSFIYGFLVMIFALILGACPLRTVLRVAYFDFVALVGLGAIVAGVVISAGIIKWNAQREIDGAV
ncbi:MAG: YeeE/YedE family protein [Candidatus Bathyarchaeota archaeon]|nr:YeeE/YedE family protein [Candidatus Bathyarchaeota archaeon]